MFNTLHDISKQETQNNIAESLNRIANALEAIAIPYTYFAKELKELKREKESWEKQAKYYFNHGQNNE